MTIAKKICMLGDIGVGKTSLVRRYVLGEFSDRYKATLGVNVYKHADSIASESGVTPVNLIVWDIEGRVDRQHQLQSYIRGAAGALIVGDLTRDDMLASLRDEAIRFQQIMPGRPVVFGFNKVDLRPDLVGSDLGASLIEEFSSTANFTSAATGEAVPTLFQALARRILELGA